MSESPREVPIAQIDAFAMDPFSGNPAAVCLPPREANADWMQAVAAEMNLSETAFLWRREAGEYDLRWFTPTVEVDLCGHATLASAHFLFERELEPDDGTIGFHTRSGRLTAGREDGWIAMDFPAETATPIDAPPELLDALRVRPVSVAKNRADYLIEVASEAEMRAIEPDFQLLKTVPCRGVIITATADDNAYDFVSRFFAPACGVDEDPVTGSAHCCLAPHWYSRLGRAELTGFQASARGGIVRVYHRGDRVGLYGKAVTVLNGTLV